MTSSNKSNTTITLPSWHVWCVGGEFIAAETLPAAIDYHESHWGVGTLWLGWDDEHHDNTEYFEDLDNDEFSSGDMRTVAQGQLDAGQAMPFAFARED